MDHFSGTDEAHPLLRMTAEVAVLVKEVEDLDPVFMAPEDRAAAMARLAALRDRLKLVELGVVRASGDLAADAGFKTVGGWRAAVERRDVAAARGDDRLAESFDRRWGATAAAVREGRVSMEQARVIVRGLDDLADALEAERTAIQHEPTGDPQDDGGSEAAAEDAALSAGWIAEVLARGEVHLIGEAADHTPRQLERLAERLLGVLVPDQAEEIERRALERAERRAEEKARLRMSRQGDGTTRISARVPDAAARMLKSYLGSLTSPRVTYPGATSSHPTNGAATGSTGAGGVPAGGMFGDPGPQPTVVDPWLDPATGRRIPQEFRDGQAFVSLIERISSRHLPQHGGLGAGVVVTIDYESLRDGVGHGTIGDPDGEGTSISVGQVRRLACASGILPAVLGSDSVVLDMGRTSRFFKTAQRTAHNLTHPTCETLGCSVPAEWTEAHHKNDPWAAGGSTDLADLANLRLSREWFGPRRRRCRPQLLALTGDGGLPVRRGLLAAA